MMRGIIIFAICGLLAGCNVSSRNVGSDEFDASKLSYFKDARTNICYSVFGYDRVDSRGMSAAGLSHTAVACSPEVLALVRK